MIDKFAHPQGDLQTWDEAIGEQIAEEVPGSIRALIEASGGDLHLVSWRPSQRQLMTERAIMIGGLLPPNDDQLDVNKRTVLRVRDKISGLCFRPTNPLTLNVESLLDEDAELLNAAYARVHLHPEKRDQNDRLFQDVGRMWEWLNFPIKDYHAYSVTDIARILTEIRVSISRHRRVAKLWLRGQRREYPETRNAPSVDSLPFVNRFPSLVPSLGRFALSNPGKVNFGYAFGGPSHWWKKPFLIWVIRQNPSWLAHYPEFRDRLEQALRNDDEMVFSQLLAEMVIDPRVPTEVDDLRQWFFAYYKYSAWVWVLQMYGYLSSILDITEDVDIALFFTQAQMIDGRFEMPPPNADRVLYVFVEWDQSVAFRNIKHVDWGDSDWARQLPPRVDRQSAGCLVGSTWYRQNYYGHLAIARIRLSDDCLTTKRVEDIFPPPDQDLLLKTLLEARPTPEGLYW